MRLLVFFFSLLFGKLKDISLLAKTIFFSTAEVETYGLILQISLKGARIPMSEKKGVTIILSKCVAFSLEPLVFVDDGCFMLGDCSIIVYAGFS